MLIIWEFSFIVLLLGNAIFIGKNNLKTCFRERTQLCISKLLHKVSKILPKMKKIIVFLISEQIFPSN